MRHFWQVAIFIGLTIMCVFLLFFAYSEVESEVIAQVNSEQAVHARQAATGIKNFFVAYNNSLSFLAGNPHIVTLDADGRELMRDFFSSHSKEISSITRVDEQGYITYTYPFESSTGTNISSQSHVRQLVNTKGIVISDVFTSVQGFRAVAFHMPIFEGGSFRGSIAILIPFDALAQKYLGSIRVLDSGYAWAISRDGIILYSPHQDQVGKSVFEVFPGSPAVTALAVTATDGSPGSGTYTIGENANRNLSSRKFQTTYLPATIGTTSWSILVSTPENEILATIQGFRNYLVVISTVLVISLLFFSYYVARARGVVKEEEIRNRAEDSVRESEEFNRGLVENLPDIIAIYDGKGIVRFANRAGLSILGSPLSKVLGEPILSFVADYQREEVAEKMKLRLSGGQIPPYEVDIRTGSGAIITTILQAVPIRYQKEAVVLVLVTDITVANGPKRRFVTHIPISREKSMNGPGSLHRHSKPRNLPTGSNPCSSPRCRTSSGPP